ncbi:hypothetical protein [Mycobacteroides abscessus]|uniref:hypothetical protein n=1 Tax=Mycobacteroides abscessus TaxID=36809 RepID=UPI001F3AB45C|nr:hypothetical protein [Mycobacteroides abscessus]
MEDAAVKVLDAKRHIRHLVRTATSEIKDAITSETEGRPANPSSSELITKYRDEIKSVARTLTTDLDAIGHSLAGDPGASRTPSYISVSTASTPEQADPHVVAASYTGDHHAPELAPHELPPMPRATSPSNTESPSAPSAPSVPAAPHPTLANLIGGQATPTGSPGGTSAPHTPSPTTGTPSTPSPQPSELHQTPRTAALPRIPSIPLDGLPVAAAESVATVVSSATAHQLPTAPSTITPTVPASTGFTPGVSGTPPVTPVTPTPLSPIGGGGLATPAVTQPTPQAAPAAPSPAPQQPTTPSPTRSPVADVGWIQRTYGLAPGAEVPKPETVALPALFITDLPEPEAHLHRALGTLRQEFEQSGWSQPLAVATLKRGFETRTVYVTADAVSIHPSGILLPVGVIPLNEMLGAPTYSDLSGSIMVTEKLTSMIPRGWTVEGILSTVAGAARHQTSEQFQELVQGGELLPCTVSRGRGDVEAGEAMAVFARAALGSGGCGELDSESACLRAARWVGVQPVQYGEVLSRWYLSDAAESMSAGRWSEAVYASRKYLGLVEPKSQVA